MPSKEELVMLQSLPLEIKQMKSLARIKEWIDYYGENNVCVAFSGGKDSTVLLHLVRKLYPNVRAVFSDTGLEYPEIREFVKSVPNVDWVKPKQTFREITIEHGYPLFSKEVADTIRYARKIVRADKLCVHRKIAQKETIHKRKELLYNQTNCRRKKLQGVLDGQQEGNKSIYNKEKYLPACQELPFLIGSQCCNKMKKQPMKAYQHKNNFAIIVGTTTEESMLRKQGWLKTGCNAYNNNKSQPLSFWKGQDILRYIKENNLKIASVYGDIISVDDNGGEYYNTLCGVGKLKCSGCQRTGCMYCAFGAQNEHKRLGKSRYELLAVTHPKIYDYCMRGGEWRDNPYYDETAPTYDKDGWKNWNPKKIWMPNEKGLGLRFVFEQVNQIYGKDFIKY